MMQRLEQTNDYHLDYERFGQCADQPVMVYCLWSDCVWYWLQRTLQITEGLGSSNEDKPSLNMLERLKLCRQLKASCLLLYRYLRFVHRCMLTLVFIDQNTWSTQGVCLLDMRLACDRVLSTSVTVCTLDQEVWQQLDRLAGIGNSGVLFSATPFSFMKESRDLVDSPDMKH